MSDTEIKNLKRKRGVIKGKLTNFETFLDKFTSDCVDDELLTELENRLEKINNLLDNFEEVQNEIELLSGDVTIEIQNELISDRTNFEDLFFKLTAIGRNILNKKKINKDDSFGSKSSKCSEIGVTLQARPKLPSIPVPKFGGNIDEWMEFKDTFESLIHNNNAIADVEKFHFLKQSLHGEPEKMVKMRKMTSENYEIVWKLLCDRYDDKPSLVGHHLDSILSFNSLKRESATSLREMLDTLVESLFALEKLNVDTNSWDPFLIHLMAKKLDHVTFSKWEEFRPKKELVTLDQFKDFLNSRVDSLKNIEKNKNDNRSNNSQNFYRNKAHKSLVNVESEPFCEFCKDKHFISNCSNFLKLKVYSRYQQARRLGLCLNCLQGNHVSKVCMSGCCRKCGKKHNTLLHYEPLGEKRGKYHSDRKVQVENDNTNRATCSQLSSNSQASTSLGETVNDGHSVVEPNLAIQSNVAATKSINVNTLWLDSGEEVPGEILLSTALVQVVSKDGKVQTCRALLDTGSQPNLITNEVVEQLGLPQTAVEITLAGIGNKPSSVGYRCNLMLQSNRTGFKRGISCFVVPRICGLIPSQHIPVKSLDIPQHIKLADPGFCSPGSIDLLLGVDIFYEVLCVGQVRLGPTLPMLQKTRLGWIVTGSMRFPNKHSKIMKCNLNVLNIEEELEKFWRLEEVPFSQEKLSQEELECEKIFNDSTTIGPDGKFMVRIPLQRSVAMLGQSRQLALNMFYKLERRLEKNEKMREMYTTFMKEYVEMGHMSLSSSPMSNEIEYFFPHHGVLNENSETTKLRVVFNGSANTDTGISFNDLQFNGPKLQEDLLLILLRFRQHSIVVCGDIAKMYRMIWVAPDQRCLQKIWWRSSPAEELLEYTLNTVTYGTRSAPYLAIRCLKEIGLKCQEEKPEVSRIILRDFYVDDLLTGSESESEAIRLCKGVAEVLKERGMELRKWVSNKRMVQLSVQGTKEESESIHFGGKDTNKTLGLIWDFKEDYLKFVIDFPERGTRHTKRSILSEVSRIFDPLGLVGPSVVLAKIILQKLWQEKIDWDESLPYDLDTQWKKLRAEFLQLNSLQIGRHTLCVNPVVVDIHGFSDASMVAYGACVYLRSVGQNGVISVNLLCSKVKVAPLKSQTIPRLELCGALLLARLIVIVKSALTVPLSKTFYWTDSTVVLGWLATESCKLQTFVSNRVSQIQSLSNIDDWGHVQSEHNPADVLSRGILPSKLVELDKWWFGPEWLRFNSSEWPNSVGADCTELPEIKKVLVSHSILVNEPFHFEKFSNLKRLRRAVAYCFRFVSRAKYKVVRLSDPLTPVELDHAMSALVSLAQRESFGSEIDEVKKGKNLTNKNLQSLCPFLDKKGLLRVGGRLKLANIPYNKKHPLLLSSKHRFTTLLCEMEHNRLMHAGPQLLLSSLRENYWILGGRSIVRKVTRTCVRCFKVKPVPKAQIMGELPPERVNVTPPFYVTGTDYAGPFLMKTKHGRGSRTSKCYICLFVCFCTKALHLEVVSDLTSEAFLACLKRFTSRRGKPAKIYSDNGLNYVGACHELKDLQLFLEKESSTIGNTLCNEGIEWKFIPPQAPHFGGLWESGVKSCKYHLKRVLGNTPLTFEDFSTLLVQIEAILNSRPLVPMSSSPNDLDVLTPSHFLIGRRLTSIPDPSLEGTSINRLSRWQHIQMMNQHFWKRWSAEYLSELQTRSKWTTPRSNIEVGQLVLVKDDRLPPLQWKLGRVIDVFCGPDDKVRVALIKTQLGEYKRPISKLCPLPV